MKFDLNERGLHRILKPYQAEIMRYIWENEESNSRKAWNHLQGMDDPELRKSRAAVIGGLNLMVSEGLLDFREESGKGGYHKLYYPVHGSEEEFRRWMAFKVSEAVSSFLKEYEEDGE